MPHCLVSTAAQTGIFGTLAVMGLTGGFTHCAGMCGPFVLAMTPAAAPGTPVLRRVRGAALVPYHAGRVTTYVAMGILFGGLADIALLFAPAKAVVAALVLLTAALMFVAALVPAAGRVFPFLVVRGLPGVYGALMRGVGRLSAAPSRGRLYLTGVLLGFMPCGMVMAALLTAAVLGSPVMAGLGMAVFALATVPGLLTAATGGQLLAAVHPRAFAAVKFVMVLASAGVLVTAAGGMVLS